MNFIQGLGAIELHSWYKGKTCVHAYGSGLKDAYLEINVTSGSEYGNKALNELQPPPYVCGAPWKKEMYDIAIDRPVFCSSADPVHPGRNIVDGSEETWWYPEKEREGEWILVDLEGSKEIKRIDLSFTDIAGRAFEIGISDDKINFKNIYVSEATDEKSFLELNLSNLRARYVRIFFKGKPIKMKKVELWA